MRRNWHDGQGFGVRRIEVARRYFGLATTAADAQRINAYLRERLRAHRRGQREETTCSVATVDKSES